MSEGVQKGRSWCWESSKNDKNAWMEIQKWKGSKNGGKVLVQLKRTYLPLLRAY